MITLVRRAINASVKIPTIVASFWETFGIFNAMLIGPTNFGIGLNGVATDIQKDATQTAANRVVYFLVGGTMVGIASYFKTCLYYMAGPIGTYRIGLAVNNAITTTDPMWLSVLVTPGSANKMESLPYIVAPFGNASWKPNQTSEQAIIQIDV